MSDSFRNACRDLRRFAVLRSGRIAGNGVVSAWMLLILLANGCLGISSNQLLSNLEDKDWRVRVSAAEELGRRKEAKAVAPLIASLRNEDADVVAAAGKALVMIGQPAVPGLITAMKGDLFCFATEPDIAGASKVLAMMGKGASGPVIAALKHDDYRIRANAAKVLGETGDPQAVEPLCAAAKDEIWRVRVNARWALEKIGKPSVDALLAMLHSSAPMDRESAAMALGRIKDARAIPAFRTALKEDPAVLVRVSAAWALGELRDRDSMDLLISVLNEKNGLVKAGSLCAMRKIAGRDLGDDPEVWQKWRKDHP